MDGILSTAHRKSTDCSEGQLACETSGITMKLTGNFYKKHYFFRLLCVLDIFFNNICHCWIEHINYWPFKFLLRNEHWCWGKVKESFYSDFIGAQNWQHLPNFFHYVHSQTPSGVSALAQHNQHQSFHTVQYHSAAFGTQHRRHTYLLVYIFRVAYVWHA